MKYCAGKERIVGFRELPVPSARSAPTLLVGDMWWNIPKRTHILCVTSRADVLLNRMSVFQLLSNFISLRFVWSLGTFARLQASATRRRQVARLPGSTAFLLWHVIYVSP
jgi:hypothetical protein